jgi:hypothetical protein
MARRGGLLGKLSDRFTDPRRAGGSIDARTRLIDPTRAVLLESVGVAEVGLEREGVGEVGLGVEVRGRINTTEEVARILLLLSPDSAALLIAQITGLMRASRAGPEFSFALAERMKEATGDEQGEA